MSQMLQGLADCGPGTAAKMLHDGASIECECRAAVGLGIARALSLDGVEKRGEACVRSSGILPELGATQREQRFEVFRVSAEETSCAAWQGAGRSVVDRMELQPAFDPSRTVAWDFEAAKDVSSGGAAQPCAPAQVEIVPHAVNHLRPVFVHATHQGHLEAGAAKRAERIAGAIECEQRVELTAQLGATTACEVVGLGGESAKKRCVDLQSQIGRDSKRSDDSEWVAVEHGRGCADASESACREITVPSEGIEKLVGRRAPGHRMHREVAIGEVRLERCPGSANPQVERAVRCRNVQLPLMGPDRGSREHAK